MGVASHQVMTMHTAALVTPASSATSFLGPKLRCRPPSLSLSLSGANCRSYLHHKHPWVLRAGQGAPVPEEWTVKITEHLEQASVLEQLRLVDALKNLGIERYFDEEIARVLSRAFRAWSECEGALKPDGSSAIFFRLLRYHGYAVSTDVFQKLRSTDTAIGSNAFQLYLASELAFPGEVILKELNELTSAQLKQEKLSDEIAFAINFPWHSVLPRVQHRFYITSLTLGDSYPGDVMLLLAKYDFNFCQLTLQNELNQILKWCNTYHLDELEFARNKGVVCYFSVASTLFDPSLSVARLTWAKMSVLTTVFDDYFDKHGSISDLRRLCIAVKRWDPCILQNEPSKELDMLFRALYDTVQDTSRDGSLLQGRDIGVHLRSQWDRLVHAYLKEAEWRLLCKSAPTVEEYMSNAVTSFALEPILMSTIFFMGEQVTDEMLRHTDSTEMLRRVSLVGRILNDIQGYDRDKTDGEFSLITIGMRDTSSASLEQCVMELRKTMHQVKLQLIEDLLSRRVMPRACKRVFESMLKILSYVYIDNDGFTSSDRLKQDIHNLFFLPV